MSDASGDGLSTAHASPRLSLCAFWMQRQGVMRPAVPLVLSRCCPCRAELLVLIAFLEV